MLILLEHSSMLENSSTLENSSSNAAIDAVIVTVLSQLKQDHPQAGPVYWSNRCWALISWQPIYLAVYAVHKHNGWFCFNKFQLELGNQTISDDFIFGSDRLQKSADITDISALIQQQVLALKPLLELYHARLINQIPLNSINAWRLIADCLLIAMLEIQTISNQQKLQHSSFWLNTFGLYDRKGNPHSQLKEYSCPDGNYLILDRKSCCMHYLIEPESPCDTCNKYSCKEQPRKH